MCFPCTALGRPGDPRSRPIPHALSLTLDVAPIALDDVDEVVYRGILLEQQVGVVYPILLPVKK